MTFLLAIIYLAFISLGLPDSLLGSAWPVMHVELGVATSYAGIITMIISFGTILSSLMSDRLNKKFGTGLVTTCSVFLTAAALFGFSCSNSMFVLCLWAIPYGLGAGAVDAALNNYVALHYSSRQMSWLHCMWGVGAAISPYIMSFCLTRQLGWQQGYRTVGILQIILTAVLLCSLPLWKRVAVRKPEATAETPSAKSIGVLQAVRIKGVPMVLLAFFAYCALEQTAMLWASSYLVQNRGLEAETAARFAAMFLIGITVGRFLSGFLADRWGDRNMIRCGAAIAIAGILLVLIPVSSPLPAQIGLMITGLGCAPIYPAIIHATPAHFGAEYSQAIIGIQMACAYVGTTFMPPLFGVLAGKIGIGCYPVYLLLFAVLMVGMTEWLNRTVSNH